MLGIKRAILNTKQSPEYRFGRDRNNRWHSGMCRDADLARGRVGFSCMAVGNCDPCRRKHQEYTKPRYGFQIKPHSFRAANANLSFQIYTETMNDAKFNPAI